MWATEDGLLDVVCIHWDIVVDYYLLRLSSEVSVYTVYPEIADRQLVVKDIVDSLLVLGQG